MKKYGIILAVLFVALITLACSMMYLLYMLISFLSLVLLGE